QNFIETFTPGELRKKTEQKLTRLLSKPQNADMKMMVIAAGDKELNTEWSVNVLFNHLEMSSKIIIITKNK
ncbi:MAG: hypothetical protein JW833_06340, partial [Prolixibacteraceae bacterium]|nr:hypothetical protein [Prolixibacteraceae bacterium]